MIAEGIGRPTLVKALALVRGTLDSLRDPNPARSREVHLPPEEQTEATPPPFAHWQLLLDGVTRLMRLPMRTLEGTGMRPGEMFRLTYGDIDFPGARAFVRHGKSKAARRWVRVPAHLLAEIDALVAREDRKPQTRVFSNLTLAGLRKAMERACKAAGIPLYSPYDLRHRFITLCIRSGMDPAAVAALVGHTKKSLTLDVYTHLLLGEEPPPGWEGMA